MKISVNWLLELSGLNAVYEGQLVDGEEIARRLTAAGLEVEGTSVVGRFAGVVVAEVRDRRRHPHADKLTLVDVYDGAAVTQVVCGAPNVPAPGGKVAWARPGAKLPGGVTLEARDVRGVVSPGMLCAEDELGIGASHDGILILDDGAAPGSDVAAVLGLPDTILELNVTPNRPDCLGHLGVAREIAALFSRELQGRAFHAALPDLDQWSNSDEAASLAAVAVHDDEGCPRYLARVLTSVVVGPSPLRIRLRLQALGIRAINNVVDATNLVLMETGQPLHAFDLDRLDGRRIVVRRAHDGERIVTLDGQERILTPDDVAICDAARPVAVAGVMGGRDSQVGAATTRVLLESASFDPRRVRRTGKRLGLHSEAAHRFERGVDVNAGVEQASRRCARLIAELSSAKIAAGAIDVYPRPVAPARIELRPARTDRVLGLRIAAVDQARILAGIGITTAVAGDQSGDQPINNIACTVPTFRPDLTREIDLIEEIARLHGYDRIPSTLPRTSLASQRGHGEHFATTRREAVRDVLAALGFAEAMTYAFVGPDRIAALGHAADGNGRHAWRGRPLRVENPLREEHSALRTSLLPGLLSSLQKNLAHGVASQIGQAVRLFEVGTIFRVRAPDERRELAAHLPARGGDVLLPEEHGVVGGVIAGRRAGWLKASDDLDFFDVKGVVEALVDALRIPVVTFRAIDSSASAECEAPWLHPGQGAALLAVDDEEESSTPPSPAGLLGEVHPDVRARFGIETRAYAFEIDLGRLGAPSPIAFREVPRFPGSARDISFFVTRDVPAAALQATMAAASPLLESVRALEDYREPGKVAADKKGMLFSLYYRSRERTLTDEAINREHQRVLDALTSRFHIEQR